jgi:SAM-dependent methyltransferase
VCNPDLQAYSEAQLIAHYQRFGEREGRRPNSLATRLDFAALVPRDARSLEIGPFYDPLLRGPNTKYFDRLTQAELVERAAALDAPTKAVPQIDFVSPTCDLTIVDETFDYVFSSHCIEHNPDLIGHLQTVERLLVPGGRYFVIVPDKRYCFDHFREVSTIADAIEAHEEAPSRARNA